MTMLAPKTFRDLEHEGWVDRASAYRDIFGQITRQAIPPILKSLGTLAGKRFLDIACGTGELTAAAGAEGAVAEGIDFAATMVQQAAGAYPSARFREGDAEQLPYADASFDAAACSFGILHVAHPEKAIAEARRVLTGGAAYTFTAWCTPEQGGEFFELVLNAVREHGTLDVPLPPAPPFFRFSDAAECGKVLSEAGFRKPKCETLGLHWIAGSPDDVLRLIYRSAVRTPLILRAQKPDAKERIHRAILEGAERYRRGGDIRIKFPAVLATAIAG